MLFHSFAFCIFLPIVFLIYWAMPHRFRWVILLLASYYFYMSWNAKYILLIFLITLITYTAGVMLEKAQRQTGKKAILAAVVICCLSILILFKYAQFILDSSAVFLQRFSIPLHPITVKLLLPVGISFYTFQSLSYVIDVYRDRSRAEHNFGIFATFISFFPQLVAGPIERTGNLLPQIKEKHLFDSDLALTGMKQMLIGFFKKLVIADAVVRIVDPVFASPLSYSSGDMLLAALLFSVQIYCDFSGYSDIAIGCAKLFGIRLMTNFQSPYLSGSFREFWGRWHISLSTWFRDYVYIPLGGNRCAKWRKNVNLMITFLLSGLWHGAGWTYILWGGIHGVLRVGEEAADGVLSRLRSSKAGRAVCVTGVYLMCCGAWVFFRAGSLADVWLILGNIGNGIIHGALPVTFDLHWEEWILMIFPVLLLTVYDIFNRDGFVLRKLEGLAPLLQWMIWIGAAMLIVLLSPKGVPKEFVYFQF